QHVLETYLCVTSDKAVFYSICLAAAIPVPKLFAVFDRPAGWTPDGRVLVSRSEWRDFIEALPQEFVIKPALGLLGKGVTAWRRQGEGFLARDGHQRSADEIYGFLCDNKGQNLFATGYSHHSLRLPGENHKSIIQERVHAHPEIEQLTGSAAVSTCRLFTHSDRDGSTQVLATAIRVINGDNFTDNFDKGTKGNVWCSVDLATGRIVDAFVKATSGDRLERVTQHPTTHRALVGFAIPHWGEAVALAHRMASVFRPQSLIHWDIGITAAGPIAIEGNVGGQILPTPLNRPVQSLLARG
ncbi:MAG: sugar-transfer associated ATP-grasp domain-containing protein, partial [Terriglobales bacterium]